MSNTNKINPAIFIVPAAVVLLWPLLKGLASMLGFAGGVLSAPGDFVKAMNQATDKAIADKVYDTLLDYVSHTTYNQNDPQMRELMQQIKQKGKLITDAQRRILVETWTKDKSGVGKMIHGAGGIVSNIKKENPATIIAIVVILFFIIKKTAK